MSSERWSVETLAAAKPRRDSMKASARLAAVAAAPAFTVVTHWAWCASA